MGKKVRAQTRISSPWASLQKRMIEAQISSKFTTWCASLPWRQMARRMACLLLTRSSTRYWFSILGRLIQRCRIAPTYRSRSKGRNIPTSSRGLRELNIYSELLPCTQVIAELSWKPIGLLLSGGPYSVYEADAPHVDPAVFELGIPILGICYGLQEIAWHFGRNVLAGEKREYGHTTLKIERRTGKVNCIDRLFQNVGDDISVWMSHGDELTSTP